MRKEIEDTKRKITQLQEETTPIVAEADKTEEKCKEINQTIEDARNSVIEYQIQTQEFQEQTKASRNRVKELDLKMRQAMAILKTP